LGRPICGFSLLSTEPVNRPVQQLIPAPRPELIADRDEVFAAIDNDAISPTCWSWPITTYGAVLLYVGDCCQQLTAIGYIRKLGYCGYS